MAFLFTGGYTPEMEALTRAFYETLSEKDARRFAALEAARLGYGGVTWGDLYRGCVGVCGTDD